MTRTSTLSSGGVRRSSSSSEKPPDDWYIYKLAAGVLAVVAPWWLVTQVRDDVSFRHWAEDVAPGAVKRLRELDPRLAPRDRPTCYEAAQLPRDGAVSLRVRTPDGGNVLVEVDARARVSDAVGAYANVAGATVDTEPLLPARAAAAASRALPSATAVMGLSLRRALGSLETRGTLAAEVLPAAEARAAAAAARAAAAAAAADDCTRLAAAAAASEAADAAADAAHALAVASAWAADAPQHTWRGGDGGDSSDAAPAPASGWWGWLGLGAVRHGTDRGSDSAAFPPPGSDDTLVELWQGAPRVRAFLPREEAAAMGDRLAVWVTLAALERRRVAAAAAEAAAAAAAAPPPLGPYDQVQAWLADAVERGRVALGLSALASAPASSVVDAAVGASAAPSEPLPAAGAERGAAPAVGDSNSLPGPSPSSPL